MASGRTAGTTATDEVVPTATGFNCGIVRFSRARKGDALSIAWVAEEGDEPVLIAAYDATRIGRDMVGYIIALRYGVPDETVEMAL